MDTPGIPSGRVAPRIPIHELTEEIYHQYCGVAGFPIVVSGVKMQGSWTPDDFSRKYGHMPVQLFDCDSGKTRSSTAGEYFRAFGKGVIRDTSEKLKVNQNRIYAIGLLNNIHRIGPQMAK